MAASVELNPHGQRLKTWLNGEIALEYTLGRQRGRGRGGAAPDPDLIPADNPVLQPR